MDFVCPSCHAGLEVLEGQPADCRCGRRYPRLPSGGLDFLEEQALSDFELDPENRQQVQCLHRESTGVRDRYQDYLIPKLRRYGAATGRSPHQLTVLDCGCGAGLSVDLLRSEQFVAWGVDAGRSRHRQWEERDFGSFLVGANALALPFERDSFDVVISSGLIEHIGIYEAITDRYVARRLRDCHEQRRQFAAELLRVLRPDGIILLDHPNGSFPIDFWHGETDSAFRLHLPWGDILPTFREVVDYFRSIESSVEFMSLSPAERLRLGRVRRKWYGSAAMPFVHLWLRLMSVPAFSILARSWLNPYLVTVISRGDFRSHRGIFQ